MSRLDERIEVLDNVALARFDADNEVEVQERLKQIQGAKQLIDNFYTSVFKVPPLPFLLVVEKEEVPRKRRFIDGPGKFIYNLDVNSGSVVPTVWVGHPKSEVVRLQKKHNTSEEVANSEAFLRTIKMAMHEYAHLYNGIRINLFRPKWFDEGLAVYLETEKWPPGHFHSRDELRKNRLEGALELVAEKEFKPLYFCHEYSSWINHIKERESKSSSNYDLAYVTVAACIREVGLERFGEKLNHYFAKRRHLNVELLKGRGYNIPDKYTLNPEIYRNNELVNIFNPGKISKLRLPTDSKVFSEKQFDLFFRDTFPQTYATYETLLKGSPSRPSKPLPKPI